MTTPPRETLALLMLPADLASPLRLPQQLQHQCQHQRPHPSRESVPPFGKLDASTATMMATPSTSAPAASAPTITILFGDPTPTATLTAQSSQTNATLVTALPFSGGNSTSSLEPLAISTSIPMFTFAPVPVSGTMTATPSSSRNFSVLNLSLWYPGDERTIGTNGEGYFVIPVR
ncbi:hypothetical protein BC938DRAFT_470868 [Jimgerdemannia flammicorona]|uniref:Uncharacterized protein n=1 Tax=Jimgerdemannia flammicorona TaxID=994334 RepID=A0A433Q9A2_9FUNG|nr:hypothetical protein BC938DRAFT_470868 [Jimgerdemannia flammicorona]